MDWVRKTDTGYEFMFYGLVGEHYTGKQVVKALATAGGADLDIRIHSDGGSVLDGQLIADALAAYPGKITVYIDGVCASMATVIALEGDVIYMAENANWMVHRPKGNFSGNSDEFASRAKLMERLDSRMVGKYVSRTGRPEGQIKKFMAAETWFDAQEAKAFGFVDQVVAKIFEATAQVGDDPPEAAYKKYKITAKAPASPDPNNPTPSKMTDEQRQIVAQAMGLNDDASIAQITAKINQLHAAKAEAESQATDLQAKLDELKKQVEEEKGKAIEASAKSLVGRYKAAKLITAASEEFWMKSAKADLEGTEAALEAQAKEIKAAVPSMSDIMAKGASEEAKEITAQNKSRLHLSTKDYYRDKN